MKKTITTIALTGLLAGAVNGQALIAGFDFTNATPGVPASATFSDLANADNESFAGPFGTFTTNVDPLAVAFTTPSLTANSAIDFMDNRTVLNDDLGAGSAATFTHVQRPGFLGGNIDINSSYFTIEVNAGSSYKDFQMSFAGSGVNTSDTGTVEIFFGTDLGSLSSIGSFDLSGAQADGGSEFLTSTQAVTASTVYYRGVFSNLSAGEAITIDNIQVGAVVPEPSAYAAIFGAAALLFVAARRRS